MLPDLGREPRGDNGWENGNLIRWNGIGSLDFRSLVYWWVWSPYPYLFLLRKEPIMGLPPFITTRRASRKERKKSLLITTFPWVGTCYLPEIDMNRPYRILSLEAPRSQPLEDRATTAASWILVCETDGNWKRFNPLVHQTLDALLSVYGWEGSI